MRAWWGLLWFVGAPSPALAEECRLHVDAGALSERMVALLRIEVPECSVVTSTSAATLSLAVMRADRHLDVDVTVPPSTPVLARRVAIDEGDPEPALRRIALLAARAVESSARLPPFEVFGGDLEAEGAPWHLSADASFATEWWSSPRSPRFGPAVALSFDVDDFEAGLWAAVLIGDLGLARLDARATELHLLIRGVWRPLELGPVSLGVDAGAGINAIWLRAVPDVVGAVETSVRTVEGLVRAGVLLEAWLVGDRLQTFVRGGGLLRIGRVELEVPPDYGEPIRTGVLVPWVEAGLSVRFF